jgi:argininosuccinate lyase
MQEDKEPLFDAVDTLHLVVPALQRTLATARFRADRMAAATTGDFSTATDLADYLVRQGVPFREAHEVVGRVVRHCLEHGLTLETLDGSTLAALSPLLKQNAEDALGVLRIADSVRTRGSYGGTSPDAVRAQWQRARARLT